MKYDVILVGAGPAGYFAAYELTKIKPSLPFQRYNDFGFRPFI